MQCNYCGKELPEGSAFCNYCGHPQNGTAGQSAPGAPAPAVSTPHEGDGTLRCPHCGSTRLQYTTTVKTQGVSVSDACCGYVCLGPLGLLCGLCGAGSTKTNESWVCCDCGTKFTTEEAQRAVTQKLQQEQNLAKKQQEKEAQLATWHSMMESCPYPPEQLSALYDEATRQAEEKDKKFRAVWDEERKAIGSWQATAYGMAAGSIIALLGVLIFVIALLTSNAVGYGILLAIIGMAVLVFFSQKDDKLFDQYASPSLRAMKEEKEQAAQHKAELKKYQEAYQGLKAEANTGS